MAEKPDLENGGSCNSGDEGIDTTEPVDDIEGNESGEPVVDKTEEIDTSGSNDNIEENTSSTSNHEEKPIGEITEEVVMEEKIETGREEDGDLQEEEENIESKTPLKEDQEKSSREILLEKRCSLTHTPDIGRVLDKEAAKASGEVHEFQKVKSELKAVEEPQVAELKISQTHEGVGGETGRSENHFLQSNVTKSDFEEVTTDTPEEEEEEEVAETILELTLAPSPMIMELTPAPVEMVKDSKVREKEKGGAAAGNASKAKNEKNGSRGKNKKGKKEDTDKKKTAGSNGVLKRQAPDMIKEAAPTNSQAAGKAGKAGKAGSPTRKAVGGKENQGDGKQARSKTRIRERTLERDDMLGTKKGEAGQKKVSVGSNKDQEEGGLMRPTKAWLNHLGDQQANPPPPRSPSPRRRPSRSSAQSSKPPAGSEAEAAPRRSSSVRGKTPKPDGRRASSATGAKNAVEASNEDDGKGAVKSAKSPRKKTSKSPPPVPPKPSAGPGTEEGVVEETISAGEAIIKFETESATFAAVSGQETAASCKESKEGKSKMSKENDIKSKKKTDASQGDDNQERGIKGATTENASGEFELMHASVK